MQKSNSVLLNINAKYQKPKLLTCEGFTEWFKKDLITCKSGREVNNFRKAGIIRWSFKKKIQYQVKLNKKYYHFFCPHFYSLKKKIHQVFNHTINDVKKLNICNQITAYNIIIETRHLLWSIFMKNSLLLTLGKLSGVSFKS